MSRAHSVTALAVVLCALLAGCATRPDAPADATATGTATTGTGTVNLVAANATRVPEVPARLEFSGCRQLHTFFPFPVGALQNLGFALPDGFTFATTDPAGAMADIFVGWWFCQDGQLNHTLVPRFGSGGSMLVGVHVAPPAALANASVDLDLYGLTWLLSSTTAANYLTQFDSLDGFVESGDVLLTGSNTVGPLVADSGTAAPSFGTFGVDTTVLAAPAEAPRSVYRLWTSEGGKATGFLEIANQPGLTVGQGAAGLRFVGDPSTVAPPFIPGTSHVVEGIDVWLVPRPLPA